MRDHVSLFRKKVWKTRLGVRAKLTLIALSELSQVNDMSMTAPPDVFLRLRKMIGRELSSVISSVDRLQKQKILEVIPCEEGYKIEFHPENEVCCYAQAQKKAAE